MVESEPSAVQEIRNTSKTFFIWVLSNVIEAFFIVIWGFSIYAANRFISQFELTGFDQVLFTIVQVLLGIIGIIPILVWVAKNTFIMLIKTKMEIREALHNEKIHAAKLQNSLTPAPVLPVLQASTNRLVSVDSPSSNLNDIDVDKTQSKIGSSGV